MFRNFSGEKSLLMPYLSKAARMAVGIDEPGRQASTLKWIIFVSGPARNLLFADVPTARTPFLPLPRRGKPDLVYLW
jgi:hypothetical protein